MRYRILVPFYIKTGCTTVRLNCFLLMCDVQLVNCVPLLFISNCAAAEKMRIHLSGVISDLHGTIRRCLPENFIPVGFLRSFIARTHITFKVEERVDFAMGRGAIHFAGRFIERNYEGMVWVSVNRKSIVR